MESIFFIEMFVNLLVVFVIFDWLAKIQYEKFNDRWVRDGKTPGFFRTPKESSWFGGSISRNVRILVWGLATEDWMKEDEKAHRLSKIMRILFVVHWILIFFYVRDNLRKKLKVILFMRIGILISGRSLIMVANTEAV